MAKKRGIDDKFWIFWIWFFVIVFLALAASILFGPDTAPLPIY